MKNEKNMHTYIIDDKHLTDAYPETYREAIAAEIIATFTEEEQAAYFELLQANDEAFTATTTAYNPEDDTITCTKEELYALFDKSQAAYLRLKNNAIAKAIVNDPRSIKLEEYQEKLTAAYFKRAAVYDKNNTTPPGDISPRKIEKVAGDICEYEKQLLKELKANPTKYGGLTLDELIDREYINDDCTKKEDGLLWALLETIKRKPRKKETKNDIAIRRIVQKSLKKYNMSIDNANQQFFGAVMLPRKGYINGQEMFYLMDNNKVYTNENGGISYPKLADEAQGVPVSLSFWFNETLLKEAGIKQDINYFDFYIMQTLYNLKDAGNKQTTVTAIAKILGYGSKPAKSQLDKIRDSITKGTSTTIRVNNRNFCEITGKKTYLESDFRLLPYRIVNEKAVIDGQIIETYIDLSVTNETPILLRLAEQTGAVTTIPINIFANPLTKNLAYFNVLYYVLMRIAKAHREHYKECKILYNTFYEETHAGKDKDKRKSRRKVLFELLDHIISCNWWVTAYEDEKAEGNKGAGVSIILNYDNINRIEGRAKKNK